jgi:hypothetical protein
MGRSPLLVTARPQSRLRYQNGCGALRIFSVSWRPIWQIGRRDLEIIDWLLSNTTGEVYLNCFHARTGQAFHKWIPATTPGLHHNRNFPPEQMRSKQRLRSKRQICKSFGAIENRLFIVEGTTW